MKELQLYLILGFLILIMVYFWNRTKKNQGTNILIIPSEKKAKEIPITLEISKKDLYSTVELDELLYNIIQKYYPDYDLDNFDNLDNVVRTFVLIVNLDGQVQNGGLIQFIDNSTGNYFHETIEAAEKIKNNKLVDIFKEITFHYPNKQIPKDWEERRELWDEMCEKNENDEEWEKLWDKLDHEYYNNEITMNQDLINYLKEHAKITD